MHQRSGGSPGWFVFEAVGGGKWIHAVIRFTGNSPGANRSVMSHYGKGVKIEPVKIDGIDKEGLALGRAQRRYRSLKTVTRQS